MHPGRCSKVFTGDCNINRRVGSGRPSEVTVEEQMQLDDETTAVQLHCILIEKGYTISLRTMLRRKRGGAPRPKPRFVL